MNEIRYGIIPFNPNLVNIPIPEDIEFLIADNGDFLIADNGDFLIEDID